MENKPNIGKVLAAEEVSKDAIHVAVAPVIAAIDLYPAQHIGLNIDGQAGVVQTPIGIVDPFLKNKVFKGESFYMFLYPNTITSLRHVWIHPAFDKQVSTPKELTPVQLSEKWIRDYAESDCDRLSYEELMDAARDYAERGEYLCQGDRFESMGVCDEFWDHYEIVTGKAVPENDRGGIFTCSC